MLKALVQIELLNVKYEQNAMESVLRPKEGCV
jgi:hypothetical protein